MQIIERKASVCKKMKKKRCNKRHKKNIRLNIMEDKGRSDDNFLRLQDALEVAEAVNSIVDIVIIPLEGIDSDTEMVDDNDGANLSLSAVRDTAGTYELHFGGDSDSEFNDEPTVNDDLYDFIEFKSEVKGIVKNGSLSTSEKINKLLSLCPKVERSCQWVSHTALRTFLAPRPLMSTKVFETRQKVRNELGDLMPNIGEAH